MPLASIVEAPAWVAQAIEKASQTTGADFGYLLKTAARESHFDQEAKAPTSSAAGLFQFIENTWLGMIKESGPQFGLGDYASAIQQTETGRSYVPDAQARAEILNLRYDPEISAVMAGAFTQQNADYMTEKLGREPTEGELYIAHFLGAGGAARFVRLADQRPDLRADVYFPRAARANRSIFYAEGKPRSIGEVYESLVSKHSETPVKMMTAAAVSASQAASAPSLPERKPDTTPLPERAPLVSSANVKVAALDKTLQMQPQTMTDVGAGGIGQWQTLVLPQPANPAADGNVFAGVSEAGQALAAVRGAEAAQQAAPAARDDGKKPDADLPVNAPRRTRGFDGVPERQGAHAAAPQRVAASRPFSTAFWEARLANR